MSSQFRTLEKLKAAMPEIPAKYSIKSLALFGYLSRNWDDENGDVDILVELNRSVGMEYIHLCYKLEKILNREIERNLIYV